MRSWIDHPVLGRGFRPFFLLAALYAVLTMLVWGGFYAGMVVPPPVFIDPIDWHAHEMIFGFTVAVVAGFLLTAVANWTGGAPVRQIHLLSLCLIWVAGRVVVNVDLGLPGWAVHGVSALFVPALVVSLAIPLIRHRNMRNFIFMGLLGVLFACALWFAVGTGGRAPFYLALVMILMMISLVGGRIIPAFTVAALRRRGDIVFQTDQRGMDVAALLSLAATGLCLILPVTGILLALCAGVAVIVHGARMRHYHTRKALSDPMLWILHAGYLWLVVGLALLACAGLGLFSVSSVLHALTAGCIGSMCLGMMCRVTLGHTGRGLDASRATVAAFALMQFSALTRLFGPALDAGNAGLWIVVSACAWAGCFALFLIVYTPFLLAPRPDGAEA